MERREIIITARTAAPREVVYQLLAEGRSWPRWSPLDEVTLERAGEYSLEGVGAIRVNRRGRTVGRDQILKNVPNESFSYATISGVPVREYVGQVQLQDAPGGGTTVTWHSSFRPKFRGTGWLLERALRRFLEHCTQGLADYAARVGDSRAVGAGKGGDGRC